MVELARLLPAPLIGTFLCDLGATVIKVELLPRGDSLRGTALFPLLHRGKYSVSCAPEKLPALLEALLPRADILLMNYRPETLTEIGLSPEQVSARFPRLIALNLIGNREGRPGHDLNFLAESGVLDRLRPTPEAPPVLPTFLFGDILGGTASATIRLLAALYERTRTQRGTFLSVAIREEMLRWSYSAAHQYHLFGGQLPPPGQEFLSGQMPCYRLYPTADGRYIALAALEEKFWKAFCEFLGRPDLMSYGKSLGDPYPHREIEAIFRSKTWAEWREALRGNTFCASPVYTFEEALQEPWAAEIWREGFLYFTPAGQPPKVPDLGEHNGWLQERLGFATALWE